MRTSPQFISGFNWLRFNVVSCETAFSLLLHTLCKHLISDSGSKRSWIQTSSAIPKMWGIVSYSLTCVFISSFPILPDLSMKLESLCLVICELLLSLITTWFLISITPTPTHPIRFNWLRLIIAVVLAYWHLFYTSGDAINVDHVFLEGLLEICGISEEFCC